MKEQEKASEQLQRVKEAIKTAQERIEALQKRITELSAQREGLIVENAISGNYSKEITSLDKEISNDQKEIVYHEKNINTLKGKLNDFEKASVTQSIIETDVAAYQTAHAEFLKLAPTVVSLTPLEKAIATLEGKIAVIEELQQKRLYIARKLDDILNEGLENLGGTLTKESLKSDREEASKHYQKLLSDADKLIDLSDKLNNLQFRLFDLSTIMPGNQDYILKASPAPTLEPEYNENGQFMRKYVAPNWELWEFNQSAYHPEDRKWILVGTSLKKPDFPSESVFNRPPSKKPASRPLSIPVKMVYGNEDEEKYMLDPDRGIVPVEEKEETVPAKAIDGKE